MLLASVQKDVQKTWVLILVSFEDLLLGVFKEHTIEIDSSVLEELLASLLKTLTLNVEVLNISFVWHELVYDFATYAQFHNPYSKKRMVLTLNPKCVLQVRSILLN